MILVVQHKSIISITFRLIVDEVNLTSAIQVLADYWFNNYSFSCFASLQIALSTHIYKHLDVMLCDISISLSQLFVQYISCGLSME